MSDLQTGRKNTGSLRPAAVCAAAGFLRPGANNRNPDHVLSRSGFSMQQGETPGSVFRFSRCPPTMKEAFPMAVKEKIRIRLKGYDHNLVDKSAEKIVETA